MMDDDDAPATAATAKKESLPMDDDQIETAEGQGVTGISALMKGLESALDDTDEEIAESILDACLRMSSSADDAILSCLGGYISTTLSKTLHVMMEEAVVIEVLFAVLAKIINSSESQKAFCSSNNNSTNNNIDGLLKAMDNHAQGEETLIEYACLVIEKLAWENSSVGASLLNAGVEERLQAAEVIITNVRNKKYVVQARAALKLP
eukprot:scaffold21143_cov53-Attheya_sp.AAC.7